MELDVVWFGLGSMDLHAAIMAAASFYVPNKQIRALQRLCAYPLMGKLDPF